MDKAQFWRLIEASKNKQGDCDKQAAKLEELLVELDGEEILGFDEIFNLLVLQANTADLWAIAYIINGYSDNRFDQFRFWLVGQGQEYFDAALQDPERLADSIEDAGSFWEGLGSVARNAYQRKTGVEMQEVLLERQSQSLAGFLSRTTSPIGTKWKDEEELKARFPRLWQKFG